MSMAIEAFMEAPEDGAKQQVIDLLTGFSVETTPGTAARIPDYRAYLRPGTTVYVTFLPGSDFDATIATAKRLRQEGLNPVPHFAARSVPSRAFLEDKLKRLQAEVGTDQALVLGGDVDRPVGEFASAMQLLETGLFDRYGVRKLGVAGHPEGSPNMSDEAIRHALDWKNHFAQRTGADVYIVTQFCFEAARIIRWDKRLRAEGNTLPIHIGVPGLASLKTMLAHAQACGVGISMRFLTRQARSVSKLMGISMPNKLIADLAAYRADDPRCGIAGVHLYPLGGLRRTAKWAYAVLDGQFTMKADGSSFVVDVDLD